MNLVTVFDNRGDISVGSALNLMLLCSSWHKHIRNASGYPLHVHVVRPRKSRLLERVAEYGVVTQEEDKPHFLSKYSPTYNKLLGVTGKKKQESLLLLDNDVFFNRDIAGIERLADNCVMANVADRQRASGEVIEEIRKELDLSLIDESWEPWEYRYEDLMEGKPVRTLRGLYFNSGVVVFPKGTNLQWTWQKHSRLISEYYSSRYEKHRQRGGFGSDQLSLSTAIHEHGSFRTLPCEYNYRIFNFLAGDAGSSDDIRIVHNAGIRKAHVAVQKELAHSSSGIINCFYRDIIEGRIKADTRPDKEGRISVIEHVLQGLHDIINEYDMDNMAELCA